MDMSEVDYLNAIKSTLKSSKVFIKRKINEININFYKADILDLHNANMDIQFILNPYACIGYIINYINKTQRGMSELLRKTLEESKTNNENITKRLKSISNVFINYAEISVQEAVYNICSMKVSKASRDTIFVNTNLPEERVRIIKCQEDLQKLLPDSTEIYCNGLIEYYVQRPEILNSIC
jgi:hypothetical protein